MASGIYGRSESGRERFSRKRKNRTFVKKGFVNPYPWMSSTEARVHLWLEARRVPFSWRWFDGNSPNIAYLMPDFHPEFTLKEYKVVIMILGTFWGTVPGIVDRNALAEVLLEEEGWTVVTLWQDQIETDLDRALLSQAPQLSAPSILGLPRTHPDGRPNLMARRPVNSSSFQRRRFTRSDADEPNQRSHRAVPPRHRRRSGPRTRIRRG